MAPLTPDPSDGQLRQFSRQRLWQTDCRSPIDHLPPAAATAIQVRTPSSRRAARRTNPRPRLLAGTQDDELSPSAVSATCRRALSCPGPQQTTTTPTAKGTDTPTSGRTPRRRLLRPDPADGARMPRPWPGQLRHGRRRRLPLVALCVVLTLSGCAHRTDAQPSGPADRAAPSTGLASPSAAEPAGPSPVEAVPRSSGEDTDALATARVFTRAMLTYSYQRPHRLAPLNRVGTMITHSYAMRLQPRQALDPELAAAARESSTVRLLSDALAPEAPHDATTRYATITYTQVLTRNGFPDTISRTWQIRLLRYPDASWRVDDVTQAS